MNLTMVYGRYIELVNGWFIDLTQLTNFRGIHSRFQTGWWYTSPSEKYEFVQYDGKMMGGIPPTSIFPLEKLWDTIKFISGSPMSILLGNSENCVGQNCVGHIDLH